MAWRIHEHVVRGEIDNRTRGRIAGRVWLAGVDEPMVLDLRGDGAPDLAGCVIRFENPDPVPLTTRAPALIQTGTAGHATAARKVRVYDIPTAEAYMMLKRGEKPPEHLANCLYLEWFSELSGSVMIESPDYRLEISEPAWRFTAEELAERERQQAEGSTAFDSEVHADGESGDWDEFRHEQMLRESDMVGEKYRRLLEEYADHSESERIIAREMGWTWLEEALANEVAADSDESDATSDDEPSSRPEFQHTEPEPDPAREGIDWVRDHDERVIHPILKRAKTALHAVIEELKAKDLLPDSGDEAVETFFGEFSLLTGKLAGSLGSLARGGHTPEPGHMIAWLKRTLEIHNRVLAAADALQGNPLLSPELVSHCRTELFTIRDEILALISRLRS